MTRILIVDLVVLFVLKHPNNPILTLYIMYKSFIDSKVPLIIDLLVTASRLDVVFIYYRDYQRLN